MPQIESLTDQVRIMSKASFLHRVLSCFLQEWGVGVEMMPNKQTENGSVPTICKSFVFTLCAPVSLQLLRSNSDSQTFLRWEVMRV